MRSVNIVILMGHLTRDPELRRTANGQPVATFSIATNRVWTTSAGQRQEATDFHDLVAWGRLAEICSQQLTKGCAIHVVGRLHQRSWTTPEGVKKHKTEIVINELNIVFRKNGAPNGDAELEGVTMSTENYESSEIDLDSVELPGSEDQKV
ncbi:MAG: single-stranded DNA-binding protein [Candidatus Abawacabacteria bacterium]|nr:single-stranded DNA-binding protein [Candidatus Abawacabacteria bacterium]